MKLNTLKSYILILLVLLAFSKVNTLYGSTNSTSIKVVARIVNGTTEVVEKIDKNLYHCTIENNHSQDIVFTSSSDIKSFPQKILLKPGEKQLFKFIVKNKDSIKLSYNFMEKTIPVKIYNDLY